MSRHSSDRRGRAGLGIVICLVTPLIEFATYRRVPADKPKVGSAGGWNQVRNKPINVNIPGLS